MTTGIWRRQATDKQTDQQASKASDDKLTTTEQRAPATGDNRRQKLTNRQTNRKTSEPGK
jgi:hypothetical protein